MLNVERNWTNQRKQKSLSFCFLWFLIWNLFSSNLISQDTSSLMHHRFESYFLLAFKLLLISYKHKGPTMTLTVSLHFVYTNLPKNWFIIEHSIKTRKLFTYKYSYSCEVWRQTSPIVYFSDFSFKKLNLKRKNS